MWPNTQWHRIYTGLGNRPYVQLRSVGDFISELRCSKFAVGLQKSKEWEGGVRGPVGLWTEWKRECVYVCCLVLLPTSSGTEWPSAPTILFMFRHIWQALSCSSGTVNDGVHNTVYTLTRLAGSTVFAWHALMAPSCRCAGHGRVQSSVLRLTWAVTPSVLHYKSFAKTCHEHHGYVLMHVI